MPLSKPSEPPKSPPWVVANLRLVVIWIALLVVAVVVFWMTPREHISPNPERHAGVGEALAYLDLQPLTSGSPVTRADLAGRVTLLNFWGTWRPPCRDELPHMAELRQRYGGQDAFRLLAVSCPAAGEPGDVQSLREETEALLKRLQLDLPTYYDPQSQTRAAVDRLTGEENYYPLTVLLDRHGVIRAVWVGYRPGAETEMERYIGMALEDNR
jgi:cytochrome c biogenesis protein CcmG, thiol:disulfide interchange protein DsbE